MDTDQESTKTQIRELAAKIRNESEEWLWESYEQDIAKLIIDYSIRHSIVIPLVNYDLYGKGGGNGESYDYFTPFLEAVGEEGLTNPRFKIHPEIRELVDCWEISLD